MKLIFRSTLMSDSSPEQRIPPPDQLVSPQLVTLDSSPDSSPDHLDKKIDTCWLNVYEQQMVEVSTLSRKKRQFDAEILKSAQNLSSVSEVAEYYSKVHSYWSNKVLLQLVDNNESFKKQIEELTETINQFNQTCSEQIRDFFFTDLFDLSAKKLNILSWSWPQSPLCSIVSVLIFILKFADDRNASRKSKKYNIKVNPYHKVREFESRQGKRVKRVS